MSTYNDLLDAVVAKVSGLNLTYTPPGRSTQALGVVKRKLPAVDEGIDTLPVLLVCPKDGPWPWEDFAFGRVKVTYRVEIVQVAPGNNALVAGLDTELDWQQTIANAFNAVKPVTITGLYDTSIETQAAVDRNKVNQNYDYSAMAIVFEIIQAKPSA